MVATTVIAPVASGLLTTLDLSTELIKALAYQALPGFGLGLGIQGSQNAVQVVPSAKEVPMGISLVSFGSGLGSSLFVSASAALFQNRLEEETSKTAPEAVDTRALGYTGFSSIRELVGADRLRDVLLGYDAAVFQILYLVVGLACLTIVSSGGMEWRSVKKKQSYLVGTWMQ